MRSQPSLLGLGEPVVDGRFTGLTRTDLAAGAWVDYAPGWLSGHEGVFDALAAGLDWRSERRPMYDRIVDVPRLLGSTEDPDGGHPIIARAADVLSDRYGVGLRCLGYALYRDGRDSVAWHGDRLGRRRARTIVATVSLGEPRRFGLRPLPDGPTAGATSHLFRVGHGDLVVMGGTAQRTWQHSVPKAASAGARIVVMFRHHEDTSVPEQAGVSG